MLVLVLALLPVRRHLKVCGPARMGFPLRKWGCAVEAKVDGLVSGLLYRGRSDGQCCHRRRHYHGTMTSPLLSLPSRLRVLLGTRPHLRHLTVLALESSADDTCAAVVTSSGQILSNVVLKQNHVYVSLSGSTPPNPHLDLSIDMNPSAVFTLTRQCKLTNEIWCARRPFGSAGAGY